MLHPHTEVRYINKEVGYGVFATQAIPKGTITWVQDQLDRVFTPEDISQLDDMFKNILDIYTFRNKAGNYVLCWDNGRFINHSFKSNCVSTAYDYEIAIRDIAKDEELTDDYGYLNISEPFKGREEGTRRKYVYPDDLIRYHSTWDKQIAGAFPHINAVSQPLYKFLSPKVVITTQKVISGEVPMESILTNYFKSK